jgi:putative endonuclease
MLNCHTLAFLRYAVYILAGPSRVLYIGVTNDLERRLAEHQQGRIEGFSKRYRIDRLVYFEQTPDIRSAIAREKQLKGWRREKKIALIQNSNPTWRDLSEWQAGR